MVVEQRVFPVDGPRQGVLLGPHDLVEDGDTAWRIRAKMARSRALL